MAFSIDLCQDIQMNGAKSASAGTFLYYGNLMGMKSEILICKGKGGGTKVDVKLVGDTVELTQDKMANLFQKTKSAIKAHIRNLFEEVEPDEEEVMKKFGNSEFAKKPTLYYNLDVIISVGYRVKSHVGTHFRIWATQWLRDYIIKGFILDDERRIWIGQSGHFGPINEAKSQTGTPLWRVFERHVAEFCLHFPIQLPRS